jgi:hypothetical protein
MFQTIDVEGTNTHIEIFNNVLFENRAVVERKCKNIVESDRLQMTVWRMLDAKGYKHTLRICNTNCFSSATMVARTRLKATVYVHCLSSTIFTHKHMHLYHILLNRL